MATPETVLQDKCNEIFTNIMAEVAAVQTIVTELDVAKKQKLIEAFDTDYPSSTLKTAILNYKTALAGLVPVADVSQGGFDYVGGMRSLANALWN